MKATTSIALVYVIGLGIAAGAIAAHLTNQHPAPVQAAPSNWVTDDQVAAGEWKIEVNHPPCEDQHDSIARNMQVIYNGDGPLTIECDLMPVGER